jgi:hypothetical protein
MSEFNLTMTDNKRNISITISTTPLGDITNLHGQGEETKFSLTFKTGSQVSDATSPVALSPLASPSSQFMPTRTPAAGSTPWNDAFGNNDSSPPANPNKRRFDDFAGLEDLDEISEPKRLNTEEKIITTSKSVMTNFRKAYDKLKNWISTHHMYPTIRDREIKAYNQEYITRACLSRGKDRVLGEIEALKTETTIARWVVSQRQNRRKNMLCNERIAALELLPNWYWVYELREMNYSIRINEINKWLENHGEFPSSNSLSHQEKILANWCRLQKLLYKKRDLTPKLIEMVESIDGWTW